MAALEAKGVRKETDIFVVSDHGFSTVERAIDLGAILANAGFKFSDPKNKVAPQPGEILMVGNGGSVSFYISDHDPDLAKRLVKFLQQTDFAGVLFSRIKLEGTFGLEQAHIDTPAAPDVVLSFRWSDAKNTYGAPGLVAADGARKVGKGTHASLSRFDMHNTLIAAGPDFRNGYLDELPTGNTDLAPTILKILGVKPSAPMDGRVLEEALAGHGSEPVSGSFTVVAACDLEKARWHQILKISRVGTTDYLDEGNGESVPK
jgi:arylsulfatase A-like enzyme